MEDLQSMWRISLKDCMVAHIIACLDQEHNYQNTKARAYIHSSIAFQTLWNFKSKLMFSNTKDLPLLFSGRERKSGRIRIERESEKWTRVGNTHKMCLTHKIHQIAWIEMDSQVVTYIMGRILGESLSLDHLYIHLIKWLDIIYFTF